MRQYNTNQKKCMVNRGEMHANESNIQDTRCKWNDFGLAVVHGTDGFGGQGGDLAIGPGSLV